MTPKMSAIMYCAHAYIKIEKWHSAQDHNHYPKSNAIHFLLWPREVCQEVCSSDQDLTYADARAQLSGLQ